METSTIKEVGSVAMQVISLVFLCVLAWEDPTLRQWAIIAFAGLLGVSLTGTTVAAARSKTTSLSKEALGMLVTQAVTTALVDLPDAIAKRSEAKPSEPTKPNTT